MASLDFSLAQDLKDLRQTTSFVIVATVKHEDSYLYRAGVGRHAKTGRQIC